MRRFCLFISFVGLLCCRAASHAGEATPSPSASTTPPTPTPTANTTKTSSGNTEQAPVIALLDAGSASANNQALKKGDTVRLNQSIVIGKEGPARFLIPGIGRGELVAQPGSFFILGASKGSGGSYELTVHIQNGALSIEGAEGTAALKAVHIQSLLLDAIVRDGGAVITVGVDDQGDRIVCLNGTANISLLGNKVDPWQRTAERLTLTKHQIAHAHRVSGLELVCDANSRPPLDGSPINWATIQQPLAGAQGNWADDGVRSRLGASGWERLQGSEAKQWATTLRAIVDSSYDSNITRTAEPTAGLALSGQLSLGTTYTINKVHSLRAGAQARAWEYPRHHTLQLWMGGANFGWQMKKNDWFGGLTASAVRFWGDRDTGSWNNVKEVADITALRGDVMRMIGKNIVAGQVSTSYEYYPGGDTTHGKCGVNNTLRIGDTVQLGSGRMIDIGLRNGIFSAHDAKYAYTSIRPSLGIAWRYLNSCDASLDYGYEWRRFKDNLQTNDSRPRVQIHDISTSSNWWFVPRAAIGPFLNYTYQSSTDALTDPTYHRIEVGLRLTVAW